jgi:hypothetical protein
MELTTDSNLLKGAGREPRSSDRAWEGFAGDSPLLLMPGFLSSRQDFHSSFITPHSSLVAAMPHCTPHFIYNEASKRHGQK